MARIEQALGIHLPETIKWLLVNHGYSSACGLDGFTGRDGTIDITIRCRVNLQMPENLIILNDWGDAGIIVLKLPSEQILWLGAHSLDALFKQDIIEADVIAFEDYPAWVQERLADMLDEGE